MTYAWCWLNGSGGGLGPSPTNFGPSPKFNGMILGPYLTPPPSFVEIHRVFPEYCSQTNKHTNKQTNKQKGVKTVTSDLRWRRLKIGLIRVRLATLERSRRNLSVAAASIASIAGGGGPVTKPKYLPTFGEIQ